MISRNIIFQFTILLLGLSSYALAQETPYYARPSQRKLTNNTIALPNLKTEKVYWYINVNPSFRWTGQRFDNNLNDRITTIQQTSTNWDASFGINRDDKWQVELGYIKMPHTIQWQLIEKDSRRGVFPFSIKEDEATYLARFKKRLWILDKVTKNTRLNLTAGLLITPTRKTKVLEELNAKIPTQLFQNRYQDTLFLETNFKQKSAPLSGEIGFELINRLADPIEIGLFAKYIFSPKGILSSDISLYNYQKEPENTKIVLNGIDFLVGVSLRWNILHGIRYLPDIK
jgi:hypothetical protein